MRHLTVLGFSVVTDDFNRPELSPKKDTFGLSERQICFWPKKTVNYCPKIYRCKDFFFKKSGTCKIHNTL